MSTFSRLILNILCLVLFCECSSQSPDLDPYAVADPTPAPQQSSSGLNYRLQIGDEIDVFVLEDSGFNGNYPVRASGDVILPKLGRVQVVGKTLSEAEAALKRSLEMTNLKQATVILDPGKREGQRSSEELVVRLAGSVAKSGRVSIPVLNNTAITAYQSIMDVGGFAPFANKKKSYIIRSTPNGTRRINVDFDKIEKGIKPDVPVQSGDSIIVPQKMFGF
jgi:polysaccharide biosynthesis/export protein